MNSKNQKNILPKPGNDIHLANDGYSLDKSKLSRQTALKKSSKKFGSLRVLKRLNLIRNLTKSNSKNKSILTNDVNYLKRIYAKEKNTKNKKSGSKRNTKNKKSGSK